MESVYASREMPSNRPGPQLHLLINSGAPDSGQGHEGRPACQRHQELRTGPRCWWEAGLYGPSNSNTRQFYKGHNY